MALPIYDDIPELSAEAQAIARRKKIAEAMLAQGQQPMQGTEMAGQVAVRNSPFQGLAKLLQTYSGVKQGEKADQDLQGLADKRKQMVADAMANVNQTAQGQSAVGEFGPQIPVEGNKRQAAMDAISSNLEEVRRRGEAMLGLELADIRNNSTNNQRDSYFTAVPTDSGLGKLNARTGEFELVMNPNTGNPYVKSADSPELQGKLAYSKEYGQQGATPTDVIPGQITTGANVVDMINQNKMPVSQPTQTPTSMQNQWQIPPSIQAERDGKRLEILLSEQQAVGGAGKNPALDQEIANMQGAPIAGIKVPTEAEKAASKEQAVSNVKLNMEPKITEANEAAKITGKDKGNVIGKQDALTSVKRATELLNKGIYTGGYTDVKSGIAKYTPFGDKDTLSNTQEFIAEIGNTVVPRLQEFGGNDSNEELRYLKSVMGGDISIEPTALKNILKNVQAKIQRGIDRASRGLTPDGLPVGSVNNSRGFKVLGKE